jgi:S-DNA-T family DNA segregation ATPase FtsK/SpoIIIE
VRLFTLRGPVLRVPWPLVVLGWALRLVVVTVLWVAIVARRHPDLAVAAVVLAGAAWLAVELGWWSVVILYVAFIALLLWRENGPTSFDRWIDTPVRSRVRRRLVYLREWQPAMLLGGLEANGERPVLVRVIAGPYGDTLLVRVVPGQTVEDWRRAAPRLAAAWSARAVRVRRLDPHGRIELAVARRSRPVERRQPAAVAGETPRGAFPRVP